MKKAHWAYNTIVGVLLLIGVLLAVSAFSFPGNIKFFAVKSGSMEPTIKTGAIIAVKPTGPYVVDDIVTFVPPSGTGTPTTHRIIEVKGEGSAVRYVTKGDANDGPDLREIFPRDIVGKMVANIPYMGYPVAIVQTKFGFLGLLLIPALWVIYKEARKIHGEVKRIRAAKDNDVNA